MRTLARYLITLLSSFVLVSGFILSTAAAQTPPPGVEILPFRLIVSGPPSALPGNLITFEVRADAVPGVRALPAQFVADWPIGATFISVLSSDGSNIDLGQQAGENSRRIGDLTTGMTATITLAIDAAFEGDLGFGVYVPGTGIQVPPGSIERAVTHVTAAGSSTPAAVASRAPTRSEITLPATGGTTKDDANRSLVLLLAAGAAALGLGLGFAVSLAREPRG